jgi:hypothetical protein
MGMHPAPLVDWSRALIVLAHRLLYDNTWVNYETWGVSHFHLFISISHVWVIDCLNYGAIQVWTGFPTLQTYTTPILDPIP